jgi:protein-tyrosine phosphatase
VGGFVDLHLHLLPNVDDGARSVEDALEMARALVALGFVEAAPSPHNQPHYASAAECAERLAALRAQLGGAGLKLALHSNSENQFIDAELLSKASGPEGRRIGTSKALLVEAPYTTPLPSLPDLVFRLKLKGVTPVIAHPERCLEFEKKGRAADLARAGALLQLDLGSLTGRYGDKAKKLAQQFLTMGLYALAASDLHSPVGAEKWLGEAMKALEKQAGAKALQTLLGDNPARLLAGQPLDLANP